MRADIYGDSNHTDDEFGIWYLDHYVCPVHTMGLSISPYLTIETIGGYSREMTDFYGSVLISSKFIFEEITS